jgi:hypothetical protein
MRRRRSFTISPSLSIGAAPGGLRAPPVYYSPPGSLGINIPLR